MKRRIIIIPAAVVLAIVLIALVAYFLPPLLNTRLTFKLEDAVSHGWVWDATVSLENKQMTTFYQSDRGPTDLTFSHLSPGKATLKVSAPDYVTQDIPVTLHRGSNKLPSPVDLVGYRIPNLDHFTMFESDTANAISVQVRPVSTSGSAVTNHPCLNLWIGVLVSAEMKDGSLAQQSSDSGAVRGAVLYRGKIPWSWSSDPSTSFRYTAKIPYSDLSSKSPPYLVIDYLVIVPDPRKITSHEVDTMMAGAPDISNVSELKSYLDKQAAGGRFHYYLTTSWNVKGPGASG